MVDRRDVQWCAWCGSPAPGAQYCRSCDFELVADADFAVARMLKSGSVDMFALPTRLRELPSAQRERLEKRFAAQEALVVDALTPWRARAGVYVQPNLIAVLEMEWLLRLPLVDASLAALEDAARRGRDGRSAAERLADTTDGKLRALLAIACARRGEIASGALRALDDALDDTVALSLRVEALCAAGHWRIDAALAHRGQRWRIEPGARAVAEVWTSAADGAQTGPWAAAGMLRCWPSESLAKQAAIEPADVARHLDAGASGADRDLRVSCLLALADGDRIATALDDDSVDWTDDELLVLLAALAPTDPERATRDLKGRSDAVRDRVVSRLRPPLDSPVRERLVDTVEHAPSPARERIVGKLLGELNATHVARLVDVADRHADEALLRALLRDKTLPTPGVVVDAVWRHNLAPRLRDGLHTQARVNLHSTQLCALLGVAHEEESDRIALSLAETRLAESVDHELHRALLHVVFDPRRAVATRRDAVWALVRWRRRPDGAHPPLQMEAGAVRFAFGDWPTFFASFAGLLRNDALMREAGVTDWVAKLLRVDDGEAFSAAIADSDTTEIADALIRVASGSYWPPLRRAAIRCWQAVARGSRKAAEQRTVLHSLADEPNLPSELRLELTKHLTDP